MKRRDVDVTDLAVQEERAPALRVTLVRDDDRRPLDFRVCADPAGHFFRPRTEGCGG